MKFTFPILFLLLLISPKGTVAQEFPELQRILRNGNLAKLNAYVLTNKEIYQHDFTDNNIYWRLFREISPGYYEGTLQIFYCVPYSDWRHKVHPYRIQVLIKDSLIFYYSMKSLDTTNRYQHSTDSSVNKVAFENLQHAYAKFYGVPLNFSYLFIDSLNYGNSCRPGQEAVEFRQMNQYVAARNQKALVQWLRTGNTELQLFAVQGLRRLNTKNIPISSEVQRIIDFVLAKKGNANICMEGVERRVRIQRLASEMPQDGG
ncbi:MAG: hypothetical protein EOP49_06530 [Sphingobacteriales bacterium]|nr:MAG: hypothetical protein EOP49_06530 [Sphingobacteriales bacterium]